MTINHHPLTLDQPAVYEIRVQGWIGERWRDWFEGLDVQLCQTTSGPVTLLTGPLPDQAALLGLLQRLYSLGFPLVLVHWIAPTATDLTSNTNS